MFERLAQCVEEEWSQQWSVKRVHGVAEPMKESAYKKELSKDEIGCHFTVKSKGRRKRKPRQVPTREQDRGSPSAVANSSSEGPLELTEALSHKALSAAVFVPIPNRLKPQATSSLTLERFRNSATIHLWHLAAHNLADDGAEEKDPERSVYTAFRSCPIRHAYARSYQTWLANKSIRDLVLKRTIPDATLTGIDCAIQSCHIRLERWPNLTINPWLLGYLIAIHHGSSEESFRRFTATNFTSCFGFLAHQFAAEGLGEGYPRLQEFTRTGCIGGSASLLGALFGQGQYRRATYRPSSNVRTLGVEFLKDIGSAALLERQPMDWWIELAATRTLMDLPLNNLSLDYFAIFEKHCRRYEEIFAVPLLQ